MCVRVMSVGLAQEVPPCAPFQGLGLLCPLPPLLVQSVAPNSLTPLFPQPPGTVCTAPPVATEGD